MPGLRKTARDAAVYVLLIFNWTQGVLCGQSFREVPETQSVVEGAMVLLKCSVNDLEGQLQWTKNSFALGYNYNLPGYPRYEMLVSEALGDYNLRIQDIALFDDDRYECQVTPSGDSQLLQASARVIVLVPPEAPVIDSYGNGSVVEVPFEQSSLDLTCISAFGKPAAVLTWFRNGDAVTEGVAYSTEAVGDKRQHARSVLTIAPRGEDNGAVFTCKSENPALLAPLITSVVLSVMHPPGMPVITGYQDGQLVQTGDTLRLLCISSGGNPLAQVYWYKDGEDLDFSYFSGADMAQNELVFTVQPSDNDAVYRCEASNRVTPTPTPLFTEITLVVQFAPAEVTISGHQHAKAGDTIQLSCESAISNPPAVITWFSRGRQVQGAEWEEIPSPQGGHVTMSNITVTLTDQENNVMYQCHGTNEALGETVVDTITLTVMYAPEMPTIAGSEGGAVGLVAGRILSMTCTSVGGNPPATLSWWRQDGEEIQGVTRITGRIVSSQISLILRPEDNQAAYYCNATNPATVAPLVAIAVLTVKFPPATLTITTDPSEPVAGTTLILTCKSASSNPPSVLTWWKDGQQVQGVPGGVVEAEHGGMSNISRLTLTPTHMDDQQIYACRATSTQLEVTVSDAVTLDVMFAPVFPTDTPAIFNATEGLPLIINLTASANPDTVIYGWFKDGRPLVSSAEDNRVKRDADEHVVIVDGAVLNITNTTREDAGVYTCRGGNNLGGTNITFNIDVQFAAEITQITGETLVDEDSIAEFDCRALANPLIDNMVVWTRSGYDMNRVEQDAGLNHAKLVIYNVTKDDTGTFVCEASNGIGLSASKPVQLIVKYAPVIDDSPELGKAAAEKGSRANLICRAEGAPAVKFKWYKGATELDTTDNNDKYSEDSVELGLVLYQSRLSVLNVSNDDYGSYTCQAFNDLGVDRRRIILDGTSHPDPPYDLKLINATHNSIAISWTAGFNGGAQQRFQVRYTKIGDAAHRYADVNPPNATVYQVTGLSLGTEYELTVQAINHLGESPFQRNPIFARTAATAPVTDELLADDMPLFIILTVSIFGLLLLAFNVVLILFFVRRRCGSGKGTSDTVSQSNTLEMYGAPTIEDSKSMSTYDHRSLEDFKDNYGIYGDDDEMKRFLSPPAYGSIELFPGTYPGPPSRRPPVPPGFPENRRSYMTPHGPLSPYELHHMSPHGSLTKPPRSPDPPQTPDPQEEEDIYADQLRKLQQQVTRDRPHSLEGPPKPPPPPTRSSSRPPIPSRNYGPEETGPRYAPAPGTRPKSGPPPPPEFRGHLV